MKRFLVFFFLIFSACQSRAENFPSFEITSPLEIPLLFDQHAACPSVMMEVQNTNFTLLLDTGANEIGISLVSACFDSLEKTEAGSRSSVMGADGKVFRAEDYLLSEVNLSGLSLTNLIVSQEGREIFGFSKADGILGGSILRQFGLLLDYQEEILTLYPKGSLPEMLREEGWKSVKFELSDVLGILVQISINGEKERTFILDTGAGGKIDGKDFSVCLKRRFTKNYALTNIEPFDCFFPESVSLCGEEIDNDPFLIFPFYFPLRVDGLFGSSFFFDYKVFIDYENERIYFKSFENSSS